ncbi:MAG: recombination regulator RecX [Oscillospiraceae bacterium]|nr:recombination regulator RecX [Oscillospiraceae bacterium]
MLESNGGKTLESTKQRALKILGNRQMSAKEMEKRLIQKGEPEENAGEAVRWLEKIGAVNDTEFAGAICRHYSAKGYGPSRIKDELYKRGIPRELRDDALAAIKDTAMDGAAVQYLNKKLRGSTDKDDIRRAADALCRRGFGYENARLAVARYLEKLENTEEFDMMD